MSNTSSYDFVIEHQIPSSNDADASSFNLFDEIPIPLSCEDEDKD